MGLNVLVSSPTSCNVVAILLMLMPLVTTDLYHLSPVLAYDFLSRCKFNTLTPRQTIMADFYSLALSHFSLPVRKPE